jgi:uncharacterized protein (TIRG00374 family)
VLAYVDERNRVFDSIPTLASALAVATLISLAAYLIRYARWYGLLARRKLRSPVLLGCLAYFAGFAFTATPGKVGELVRIRYFSKMGIPHEQVFACFVFERASDLIAITVLALSLATVEGGYWLGLTFLAIVLLAIVILTRYSWLWQIAAVRLRHARFRTTAKLARLLGQGFSSIVSYFNAAEISASVAISAVAWCLQSLGFVYLLSQLGVAIPMYAVIGLYSLASLIGAASFLPGGIGTTEVTTVIFLHHYGVPFDVATVAAIGMRLSSIWWAVALGLASVAILEARNARLLRD